MTKSRTLKRWSITGAVMLLAAMTFMTVATSTASAQETDLAVDSQYRFRTVEAVGSGVAGLHGRYIQAGSLGAGVLIVSGNAHVQLEGFERRIALGDDRMMYVGVRGHFRVSGDDISSVLMGAHIRFDAEGNGSASFAGDGSFSINGRPRQPWS